MLDGAIQFSLHNLENVTSLQLHCKRGHVNNVNECRCLWCWTALAVQWDRSIFSELITKRFNENEWLGPTHPLINPHGYLHSFAFLSDIFIRCLVLIHCHCSFWVSSLFKVNETHRCGRLNHRHLPSGLVHMVKRMLRGITSLRFLSQFHHFYLFVSCRTNHGNPFAHFWTGWIILVWHKNVLFLLCCFL